MKQKFSPTKEQIDYILSFCSNRYGWTPTPEQLAFISHIVYGRGNLIGKGVAGCGKSKTMEMALKCAHSINPRMWSVYLVFNKKNQEEFSERMRGVNQCCVSTMHSLGNQALRKAFGSRVGKPNNLRWSKWFDRNADYLCPIWGTLTQQARADYKDMVLDLFQYSRLELLDGTDCDAIVAVGALHGIKSQNGEIQSCAKMLQEASTLFPEDGCFDFTDMIYIPCMNPSVRAKVFRPAIVIGDECQDFSKATQTLLKIASERGRWIAVGDPKQAINGFAGSMCDSYEKLYNEANTAYELTYNFRCGKVICAEAQKLVPELKAFPKNCEGEITHVKDLKGVNVGDLILCRKTAPLISLCLKFMAKGIPANVVGNDIAASISKLIEKVCKGRKKSVNPSIYELYSYLDDEYAKLEKVCLANGQSADCPQLQTLRDKIEIIHIIGDEVGVVKEIVTKLQAITQTIKAGDESKYVRFSTVHRAKGAEAPIVYIIAPDKLPLYWPDQMDWEAEQEQNLLYVAVTRAMKRLTWVDVPEKQLGSIEL